MVTRLTCSVCGAEFGRLTALIAHYAACHGDPYGHCEQDWPLPSLQERRREAYVLNGEWESRPS